MDEKISFTRPGPTEVNPNFVIGTGLFDLVVLGSAFGMALVVHIQPDLCVEEVVGNLDDPCLPALEDCAPEELIGGQTGIVEVVLRGLRPIVDAQNSCAKLLAVIPNQKAQVIAILCRLFGFNIDV